jgi:hypothetical protein
MATTIDKIAREAAELTKQERLTLVRLLLDLDQPSNGAGIANAWESEIRARVKAVDEDRVSLDHPAAIESLFSHSANRPVIHHDRSSTWFCRWMLHQPLFLKVLLCSHIKIAAFHLCLPIDRMLA